MASHTDNWLPPFSSWNRRGAAAAFGPPLLALFLLPCLLWIANRMAQRMQVSAAILSARPDLGHAVIGGVNAALLGIVLVVVLCSAYSVAGWAVGGLLHGLLAWWNTWPRSRLGWAAELLALAMVWGGLFYALHNSILIHYIPPSIEPLLVWFGLPGLVYALAATLRQGDVI